GNHTLAASYGGSSQYSHSSASASLTITAATPTLSIRGAGAFPYTNAPHAAVVSVQGVFAESLGPGSVTYTNLSNGTTSSSAPSNIGSYRINASFAGNSNYSPVSDNSLRIIIVKADT